MKGVLADKTHRILACYKIVRRRVAKLRAPSLDERVALAHAHMALLVQRLNPHMTPRPPGTLITYAIVGMDTVMRVARGESTDTVPWRQSIFFLTRAESALLFMDDPVFQESWSAARRDAHKHAGATYVYIEVVLNARNPGDAVHQLVTQSVRTDPHADFSFRLLQTPQEIQRVLRKTCKFALSEEQAQQMLEIIRNVTPEVARVLGERRYALFEGVGLSRAQAAEAEFALNRITRVCAQCRAPRLGMPRCKRCQRVYYCSVECQKRHWSKHKKTCRIK